MQMQAHDRKDVRLYYGTQNTEATAYSNLDDSWKAAGVDIVHVYSDDNKGYVQDVFTKVRRSFNVCLYTEHSPDTSPFKTSISLEGVAVEGFSCKTNVFDELQRCMNLKLLM